MTFDEYRYCKYSDTSGAAESESCWNRELLTALVVLFKRHGIIDENEQAVFNADSFEKRLREEKIIDEENMIDLAGIEKVYPVRFRRKLPFEPRYTDELVRLCALCVLEVHSAADGALHYLACSAVSLHILL